LEWANGPNFKLGSFDLGDNFLVLGEALFSKFGKGQLAVKGNLKASPVRGHQHQPRNILLKSTKDFIRQTGGFGQVVSRGAILDFDFLNHEGAP